MLRIKTPKGEVWDEEKGVFIPVKGASLQLEHSLVSLSKWESKWHKPFLDGVKSIQETLDYICCMTLTQNVNPLVYCLINDELIGQVSDYIADPMTATWFPKDNKNLPSREIVTAEVIYYWMIVFNIPFECQKWHLNKLMTLIRVCEAKSKTPKPLSKKQLAQRNTALNAARRKAFHSKG